MALSDRGHSVHVITDKAETKEHEKININVVDSLRGTNSKQIGRLLSAIKPNRVFVTITPLSLATAGWYQILERHSAYGYLSYPFYTNQQILKAFPYLCWKDRWEYGRNLLVPRRVWADRLVRLFNGVICQSAHTAQKVETLTKSKINAHTIPPGIDAERWAPEIGPKTVSANNYFLYLGTASRIRGLLLLLDAFTWLSDPDIRLKILARGADEIELAEIKRAVERRHINERVSLQGGWMETAEIQKQIQSATAVLFPFILVPSELPVSVLEVIYFGTPVIVSDLVGLPEVVGNAGIVVPHTDVKKLALAIQTLHRHKEYQAELNTMCLERRNTIMSWDSVCKLWADFITQ
jgi:glycosyltransferase involved in cell wall biosynthesis